MKNAKVTKRALLVSVLSLVLCFALLLGTTYAWFTDSASSTGNKIISGTLDIDLFQYNGTSYVEITDTSAPIFGSSFSAVAQNNNANTLWEPGKTQIAYLKLVNNGNLWLKYKVNLVVKNVAKDLYKAMLFEIIPDAANGNLDNLKWTTLGGTPVAMSSLITDYFAIGEVRSVLATASDVPMAPAAEHNFALAIHMDELAGNEFQAGEVDFDIQVVATQYTQEEDSFDNQYDASSSFPVLSSATSTSTTVGNEDLIVNTSGEIESATVPADATQPIFDSMKSSNANDSNELTMNLNVIKTGETTTSTETIVDLEIDMDAVMKITDGNTGSVTTNTAEVHNFEDFITINYNLGTNKNNVTAKHNGNAMEALTSASANPTNANGGYYYNTLTGILTIRTKSLSPFTITYTQENGSIPDADKMKTPIERQTINVVSSLSLDQTKEFILASGVKFTAPEEPEEEYANWNADFVISFDKDIDLVDLANDSDYASDSGYGVYGEILKVLPVGMFSEEANGLWGGLGGYWLPCLLTADTLENGSEGYKTGENIILLNNAVAKMMGSSSLAVSYRELCENIKSFSCGLVCLKDIGTIKVTVSLVLYDPNNFDLANPDSNYYCIASSQTFTINTGANLIYN